MSTQVELAAAIRGLIDAKGRLPARITPRAAGERVTVEGGVLKVHVTVPPADGKANAAAARAIAGALGVPGSAVTLVRGQASRDKVFRVEG